MEKLHLEVITPEKVIVNKDVESVVAPGFLGEFGVLQEHILFLSGIVPGELRYTTGDKTKSLAVTSGFAEVSNNKVSVLVDAAERSHDIDLERSHRAIERAKERLAKDRGTEDIDFQRAEASLKRAIARIKVAEKAR
jgi:F-type H+-transporting ATPase subunit epsilon